MSNTFMASAAKAKRGQADIEGAKREEQQEKMVNINVRVPSWLHHKAQLHRIETGENTTKLVNRLLIQELGDKDSD